MKIILPTVGSVPDQRTAGYVINIAKRLNVQEKGSPFNTLNRERFFNNVDFHF